MSLIFEWDDSKNRRNIAKHGIDFADVGEMFDLPLLAFPDEVKNHGETRWKAVGWLNIVLCLVVFTESNEGRIRLISARKATSKERDLYGQIIRN